MIASLLASVLLFSAVTCENGVCRLVPDEPTGVATGSVPAQVVRPAAAGAVPTRIAQGAMSERDFLAFLNGEGAPADEPFAGKGLWLVLLLAVLGGLALNLTPCVLPMVPVNLLVIGASPLRGFLYGLGQMTAFGALGLLAAVGGVAFGTVQSSPLFNGIVALFFLLFALSLFGVFPIDFTRFRKGLRGGAFLMGVLTAVLAGACVAPVLASVLLVTARLYAEGRTVGLLLPFAVGFGLALPWPFLGAGLKVLPKPGAWMRWVNRLFAVFLLLLAAYYAMLAVRRGLASHASDAREMTAAELGACGLLTERRTEPLLVYCHASWCKNCSAMERMMSAEGPVRTALGRMKVVRLDAEDPNDLKKIPGGESIRGLPAFLLYLPEN